MPTFTKPPATALQNFTVRLVVTDPGPTVTITFATTLLDANGANIGEPGGDLTPYLTPAQITAFTNAALALQAKAKTELLT